jgi:hypothetical protein
MFEVFVNVLWCTDENVSGGRGIGRRPCSNAMATQSAVHVAFLQTDAQF